MNELDISNLQVASLPVKFLSLKYSDPVKRLKYMCAFFSLDELKCNANASRLQFIKPA